MIIEGIVTAISLENMGPHAESVFVLTLEVLGSNGTKLKFPIDRSHATKYQLGQTVCYSIEALEEEFYKNEGPEAYERRERSAVEEELERMANEYEDDYDDYNNEDDEGYEVGSTIESVLSDRSDEMSDEEIAQKVGRTDQQPSEPAIAPKVEDTEIKALTESEYRAQTASTESNPETDAEEKNGQTSKGSTESSAEEEQNKSESVAPIGMMGGYPDTEDVYDDEDDE